jgi:hypothetical protein
MTTHRSTWKARERQAAAIFGARRNVLSGSSGRDDRDTSDSTHDRLHIEVKLRESHSIFGLWAFAIKSAKKNRPMKIPVIMLAEKNHVGFMVCVHDQNLEQLAEEWCVVQSDSTLNDLCERIRLRRVERETLP